MILFWICYFLLYLPLKIFSPFKVIGRQNINKKQNYIIVSNHQSNFDPILLDYVFKSRNRYLAKTELFKNIFSKLLFKHVLASIEVDRAKGITLSNTKRIYKEIENKKNIGIFPEATRKKELKEEDNIKGGACLFAIKTKTPMIPCYIVKKHRLFRKNVIIVGKPLSFENYYNQKMNKDLLKETDEIMKNSILALKHNYEEYLNEKKIVKTLKNSEKQQK